MTPKEHLQAKCLCLELRDNVELLRHHLVLLDILQDSTDWGINPNIVSKNELDITASYGTMAIRQKLDHIAMELNDLSKQLQSILDK